MSRLFVQAVLDITRNNKTQFTIYFKQTDTNFIAYDAVFYINLHQIYAHDRNIGKANDFLKILPVQEPKRTSTVQSKSSQG